MIDIRLRVEKDLLDLTITDDGQGFEPGRETGGLGLRSMRYWAHVIGNA